MAKRCIPRPKAEIDLNHPLPYDIRQKAFCLDLMKQLGLKPGVDIDTVALDVKQGVQKIGEYDKRGIAPLKNPQKKWALDVPEGAHGMVQKPGSCTADVAHQGC